MTLLVLLCWAGSPAAMLRVDPVGRAAMWRQVPTQERTIHGVQRTP